MLAGQHNIARLQAYTLPTGKQLRLTAGILGIPSIEGHRTAIMIPEGATVRVVSGPLTDIRLVNVLWEDRTLAVFAEDLAQRGKEVKSS